MSPSIAFIETPAWTGSGVLIEGGYVVTNAHVVWPFEEVRVVFPDGSEFSSAPVVGWDLLGDIAVIGPLQTNINPIELVDGEDLIVGSDGFLIGYPGEVEGYPQPTITSGIISRLREWESIGMTYFQIDATVAGGQSGGVLVSERGDVVGISGLTFTEAGFSLAASAADVLPRVDGLVAGEDVDGLGDRRVPLEGGEFESDFTLANDWYAVPYVINEPAGTDIDIDIVGESDGVFVLVDVYGDQLIFANRGLTGVEFGSATTQLDAPYFLQPLQNAEEPGDFHVRSNVRLARYEDVDDGVAITVGQTVLASMDTPGDIDFFLLDLEEGQTVEITVDSVMIDPFVRVDFPGATDEQVLGDDDGGGGLRGRNAKLTYRAPLTGSYLIIVFDATLSATGGYLLTVAKAPPEAAAVSPVLPTPLPDNINLIATWGSEGSGDGQFEFPALIAVDESGNVYVADTNNHRVQVFTAGGKYLSQWGSKGSGDGQFAFPAGIAVDGSGKVYVADTNNHRVQVFTAGGKYLSQWGSEGSGFISPTGIAVDGSGNVYVADLDNHRVQVFSSTGEFLANWGSIGGGEGQFLFPTGIAVDGLGNVYVAEVGNSRVQAFTAGGEYLGTWGGSRGTGDSQFRGPFGVAVDGSGNVYVADSDNHRVQVFSPTGELLAKWGLEGSGDGYFSRPIGIALDGSGNVYVADSGNNRMQVFSVELP